MEWPPPSPSKSGREAESQPAAASMSSGNKQGPIEITAPVEVKAPAARQLEPSQDVVIAAIVEMRELIQRYSTTQCVRALHSAVREFEETAAAPSGFMDIADAVRLQEMRKRHDAEAYHAQLERIAQHTRGKTGEDELESRRRQRPARRNKQ